MTARSTDSALDAVQFFANSAHSVRVFETLTDGPTTSGELTDRTGASRSTVARILGEGELRGWIDSVGSRYELTGLGEIMIEEFRGYRRTVEGVQHLGEAVEWLPGPVRSLDFRHFRDADVILPTSPAPSAPYEHVAGMIRAANRKYSLVETAVPRFARLVNEQSRAGELESELVIKASWFDDTLDTEQAALWRARAERNSVWTYDGEIPINTEIYDETVVIWLGEERGDERVVRGVLVTEAPAVLSWARSLFEEYRAEAEPLDRAMVSEA